MSTRPAEVSRAITASTMPTSTSMDWSAARWAAGRLMAIPGWIPGNPAGAGTCPRQKATNPDTGLAPPPLPVLAAARAGG